MYESVWVCTGVSSPGASTKFHTMTLSFSNTFSLPEMTGELVGVSPRRNELSAAGTVGGIAYDIRIRRAIEAMKQVRGIPPDFDDLAQTVGLSRPHFFHLFHKQTGMTPATFSSMLRMDLSIESVSQAEMPLQDVALDLGFDSPGNFTRSLLASKA
jgi:AraC family transcriptional regulator